MGQEFIFLNLAAFGAATLQSATGIGFGVIAGPIFLLVLNDGSAIQISIVLNLLIALSLAPSVWRDAQRSVLPALLSGLLVGAPLGLLMFVGMSVSTLKLSIAIAVVVTLVLTMYSYRVKLASRPTSTGSIETAFVGVVSGVMGASLAMPGPIPAAWMSARGHSRETVRATILVLFVFAYVIALALQFGLAGVGADSLAVSATLAPATIAGILVGRLLAHRISEQAFRRLLLIILGSTALLLFSTLV